MATTVDLNPLPLNSVGPTSGVPLSILANFPDLVFTMAKLVTFFAPSTNTGNVYIGRSTLNRSTYAGVLLVVAPGQTREMPYNIMSSNMLDLTKVWADVDTTGDIVVPVALFA